MPKQKVVLIPIAMRTPNQEFISSPSKIRPTIEVTREEFDAKYVPMAHTRTVSLEDDGVSNPQPTAAYGALLSYIKRS